MSKLQVGSLFSGIGGFDLGFERAGFEIAWQAELDAKCRSVLAGHWPGVRTVDDVRLVGTHQPFDMCPPECEEGCERDIECIGVSELADELSIDVLVGGFPCQDISSAGDRWGNRKGIEGDRSGLWWEFARIIRVAEPRWVVIENTGRLRNGREGSDLRVIVEEIDRLAYMGVGAILDAAAFGLPARRPRAFIVARRTGRDARGLSDWQGLADSIVRNDPGCVVLEGTGQPLAADHGRARPSPSSFRLLSPREAERAMGFPEDWTAGHSNSARLKMLGNAVAVPVARWVAERIIEASNG